MVNFNPPLTEAYQEGVGVEKSAPRSHFAQVSADITAETAARIDADEGRKPWRTALSTGDVFGQHQADVQGNNGAVSLTDPWARHIGFRIPAGQTGALSYALVTIDATKLRGQTVLLRNRFKATPGFLASIIRHPTTRAQFTAGGGYSALAVTADAATQTGEVLETSGLVTVPANATRVGLTLQLSNNSPVAAAIREIEIRAVEYSVVSDGADEQAAKERFELASSDLLDYPEQPTSGVAQALNGATLINDDRGAGIGITVPAGQTGASSYVIRHFSAAGLKAGDRLRITTRYEVTPDFLAKQPLGSLAFNVRTTKTGGSSNRTPSRRVSLDGTILTVTTDYVVQGDEYMLGPILQLAAGGDTSGVRSFRAISMQALVMSEEESDITATMRHILAGERSRVAWIISQGPTQTDLDVGIGGLTFAGAVAASAGASAMAPIRWRVAPGRYTTEHNWIAPAHVEIAAEGAERPQIHYELPDGSAENPRNYEPFRIADTAKLRGLDVSVRNGRYALHIEASGGNPDAVIEIKDCRFEHFGNVIGAWASQDALGMGTSSGWQVLSEDSVYISPVMSFAWHNNRDFNKPCIVRNTRDTITALTDPAGSTNHIGTAVRITPMGSNQRDQHILEDCAIVGDILYTPGPWFPTDLSYQPASHAEVQVSGKGNSPAVFRITDFGRALKIAAPSDSAASVSVSGSAVAILMGNPDAFPGATGLPAYVHGSLDVSGAGVGASSNTFITSLGQRLGNRTSDPVALTVTVGGTTRTVTFNSNHSAVSNADILAQINTAFGGVAVASLYAIGERYRPRFTDEEATLRNVQAYGIPMGSLLAYDGSRSRVRLMTSADNPSLFAGVAWEDIYPGQAGRVKTRGYLHLSDILRADAAAVALGTALSVSASQAGLAAVGGTQAVLRGIRVDAVELLTSP